jgi:3-oxoacyl-[acyl-carrier protein] reductase
MEQLKGKIAIVTGGSRGIGRAIAKKFADQGARVIITYKSKYKKAEIKDIENAISGDQGFARAVKVDVSDFGQCETFVNRIIAEYGQIDICVNNAGISKDSTLSRTSYELWDEIMVNNLYSVFNMTKLVTRHMGKAKRGSIINISSIVGIYGNSWQSSYAASKAGIIGFTKSIAKELGGKQIRCNAIAPGFIQTDMTQHLIDTDISAGFLKNISLGRYGQVEDVAGLALFLASDESNYMTGQVICVDGGIGK